MAELPSYREMSIYDLDQGYYAWRTETATTTTQRPEYWAPIGISKFALYPRTGAEITLRILAYADTTPFASSASYIDIDEGHLQKVIDYAHSLLAFKEGIPEGTDSSKPLKELFLAAARDRNAELRHTSLYMNYMGHDESKGEFGKPAPQQGVRS